MEKEAVSNFLIANSRFFRREDIPVVTAKLETLDSEQLISLTTSLKNPIIALILSLCVGVFGIDRFYVGNIGLGIAKLLFAWPTMGVWSIVDWFFIMRATRKKNLEILNEFLD